MKNYLQMEGPGSCKLPKLFTVMETFPVSLYLDFC